MTGKFHFPKYKKFFWRVFFFFTFRAQKVLRDRKFHFSEYQKSFFVKKNVRTLLILGPENSKKIFFNIRNILKKSEKYKNSFYFFKVGLEGDPDNPIYNYWQKCLTILTLFRMGGWGTGQKGPLPVFPFNFYKCRNQTPKFLTFSFNLFATLM